MVSSERTIWELYVPYLSTLTEYLASIRKQQKYRLIFQFLIIFVSMLFTLSLSHIIIMRVFYLQYFHISIRYRKKWYSILDFNFKSIYLYVFWGVRKSDIFQLNESVKTEDLPLLPLSSWKSVFLSCLLFHPHLGPVTYFCFISVWL